MGKFGFLLVVILFLSILTACSDSPNSVKAPETSAEVTTSQTETEITTAEETTTSEEVTIVEETTAATEPTTVMASEITADITEIDTSAVPEDLVDTYASILFDEFDGRDDLPIYESEVAETLPMALCYVTFCDFEGDPNPEMLYALGTGMHIAYYSCYADNGAYIGMLQCAVGMPMHEINGSKYTIYGDVFDELRVTKLCDNLPTVRIPLISSSGVVLNDAANDDVFTVEYLENEDNMFVDESKRIKNTYDSVKKADINSLCEKLIGVKGLDLFPYDDSNGFTAKYENVVSVPDGDDFTVEDLRNWVKTNLAEYYALMQ